MNTRTLAFVMILSAAALCLQTKPSRAFDLAGAWASTQADCEKMFVKRGKAIAFRSNTSLGSSGFIIDGKSIKGKIMTCAIKARHDDGQTIHLRAACASDLMLSAVQFSAKVVDENRITRYFPGMNGVEHTYYRCAL